MSWNIFRYKKNIICLRCVFYVMCSSSVWSSSLIICFEFNIVKIHDIREAEHGLSLLFTHFGFLKNLLLFVRLSVNFNTKICENWNVSLSLKSSYLKMKICLKIITFLWEFDIFFSLTLQQNNDTDCLQSVFTLCYADDKKTKWICILLFKYVVHM